LTMIHFMPFTYLPDALIEALTRAVGPVSVLQPLETLVTPAMQNAAAQGLLSLRPCRALDTGLLERAMKDFTGWADLHQGRSGDLAGFYKANEAPGGCEPEESTSQIKDRVRRGGAPVSGRTAGPLVQAALFLCLAHTYDRQQAALASELIAVQNMQERLDHILRGAPESKAAGGAPSAEGPVDRGLYMTGQRVHAWARLSLAIADAAGLFLTNSRAVWDHMLDTLPDAVRLGPWRLDPSASGQPLDAMLQADGLLEMLGLLARSPDPRRAAPPPTGYEKGAASGAALTICALTGCTPRAMLARLLNIPPAEGAPDLGKPVSRNALIGHINI
jgi:hypothetical protein